ncbi:MAG: hypothetical protein ACTSR3_16765 [Candidatus Helarchaeota archaeon]
MSKMYRQGDILFKKIKSIPKKAKLQKSDIIVKGEATGHAHVLQNGIIYTLWGEMYLQANTNATIVHEEHASIELEPGYYEVIRQREFDPTNIDPRLVED